MIANVSNAALVLLQSLELSLVAKATVVVVLALMAARLAARERAAVRHVLLASAFAALLALPLIAVSVPKYVIDIPVARTPTAALAVTATPPTPANLAASEPLPPGMDQPEGNAAWSASQVTRAIWMSGVVLCLMPLAMMLWRLRHIRRTGLPFAPLLSMALERSVARRVEFLQHEDVAAPMTFGLVRPVVVVPADALEWSREDLQRALIHELEHVRRRDWAIHVLGRLVCAVYWFHPLVWLAGRQLSLEAERAADDAVLASSESTDYAEQLVVLAQRLSANSMQPLLGMANRSDLSARVSALLDASQRRGRAGSLVAASAIGLAAVIVTGVAPLTAIARVEETTVMAEGQRSAGQDAARQVRRATRPRALDRALYEAADDGHLDEVNEIIAAGGNVNAAISGDGSALIAAARRGDIAIVRRLIEAGADTNLAVEGDGSPLIQAAYRGHLAIAALLLDQGADVNLQVPGDENPLMCASEGGHLNLVRLLVQRGANVNERIWNERGNGTGEWRTAVSQAAKNGHTAVVSFLKSAGARE